MNTVPKDIIMYQAEMYTDLCNATYLILVGLYGVAKAYYGFINSSILFW